MTFFSSLKKPLLLLLCLTLSVVCAFYFTPKTEAAAALSVSAEVDGSSVIVTVSFPDVTFAAGTVDVSFNPAHLELTAKPTTAGLSHSMIVISEAAASNTAGKCTFAIMNVSDLSAKGGSLRLAFSVKDAEAKDTAVTATVVNCGNATAQAVELGGASKSITLKQETTTSTTTTTTTTTDTSSDVSSSTTTDSDTTTSTSTKTDTSTDTTTTSTSTKTDTTSTKTSTKTSSKTSGTTDSGTTTDKGSETDTDTEGVTDTETGFPFSSVSGSNTDGGITDVTDLPSVTNSDLPTTPIGPGPIVSTSSVITRPPVDDGRVSTTTVALISVGVAVLLCGGLTALGLLRHRREE